MRTGGKGLRFGDGRDCYLVKQNCLYNEILQLIDAAHYLSSIICYFSSHRTQAATAVGTSEDGATRFLTTFLRFFTTFFLVN